MMLETLGIFLGIGLPIAMFWPRESLVAILLSYLLRKRKSVKMPGFFYAILGMATAVLLSVDLCTYIQRKSAWPVMLLFLLVLSFYGQTGGLKKLPGEASLAKVAERVTLILLVLLAVTQFPVSISTEWLMGEWNVIWIPVLTLAFWLMQLPFGGGFYESCCFFASVVLLRLVLPKEMCVSDPAVFLQLGRTAGAEVMWKWKLDIPAAMILWTALFFTVRGSLLKMEEKWI